MGGGLTDWHRQKRKKEQKKNKEKRLAERDARVLETKTAETVQDEIRQLERHHKVKRDDDGNEIPLPHNVKSKLDRLRKELKILKQAAESQQGADTKGSTVSKKKQEWKPLEHPQLSVYYDAVMNPFGEPPPGQPRLYHTADGRTTFHLHEAALPGSRPPPPPKKEAPQQQQRRGPPPPRRSKQPPPRENQSTNHRQEKSANEDFRSKQKPNAVQGQSFTAATKTTTTTAADSQLQSTKKNEPPAQEPNLPAPSQAVRRGRSKLKADIWASTEEIDYHEHTSDPQAQIKLEGVVDTVVGGKKVDSANIQQWWYEDRQGAVQGPFPHEQMMGWIKAGFFPAETRGKPRLDLPWKPLCHYAVVRAVLSPGESASKQQELSLQDRIASLRKEHKQTSIADRIAALRGDGPTPDNKNSPAVPGASADTNAEGEHDDTLVPPPLPVETSEPMNLQTPVYANPLSEQEDQQMPSYPVAENDQNQQVGLPPPPPPPQVGLTTESTTYVVDGMEDNLLPPPPPPAVGVAMEPAPYVVEELPPPPPPQAAIDEIPAYTVDDAPTYENVEDYPAPYPTGDYSSGDVAYPIGDDDGDNVPVTDDYPVVGSYPVVASEQDSVAQRPVKRAKVDREVISFLPTNLRKRR